MGKPIRQVSKHFWSGDLRNALNGMWEAESSFPFDRVKPLISANERLDKTSHFSRSKFLFVMFLVPGEPRIDPSQSWSGTISKYLHFLVHDLDVTFKARICQ